MTDFLVQTSAAPGREQATSVLRERPHLSGRPVHRVGFAWGTLDVLENPGRGYEPATVGGRCVAVAGRPRLAGVEHEADGPGGFARRLLGHIDGHGLTSAARELTGMGGVLIAGDQGLVVITDRLGSRPVYAGHDDCGAIVAVGSHLESVAWAAGRERDFDEVSLGELVVHNYITFPHTSRRGVVELDPGTVTEITPGGGVGLVRREAYWEPREPNAWPGRAESVEELAAALALAGDDVTRGCSRVAVTLSGGKDSRLVMGVVPHDRLAAALTYCTRENRETDVARRVAEAFGTTQVLVRREPDYYAHLLARGSGLLGLELRSNAHGLCVADSGLGSDYDLVLGGQLSDTLLKDHFMPIALRQRLRVRPLAERAKAAVRGLLGRRVASNAAAESTLGREGAAWALDEEILEAVRERRAERLERVREIRPVTAEEWFRFWPASRQDDSSHTLGNSRLFASDTLFLHTSILEAARRLAPEHRVGGELADGVFERFYGASTRVENANTGLPISASARAIRAHRRRLRRDAATKEAFHRLGVSDHPWNDVQGSWVDSRMLQEMSPDWQNYRREALDCGPAVELLDRVLAIRAREILGRYDDRLPPTANHLVMQIAWIVGSIEGRIACLDAGGEGGAA